VFPHCKLAHEILVAHGFKPDVDGTCCGLRRIRSRRRYLVELAF
jgi:hypothetical protein